MRQRSRPAVPDDAAVVEHLLEFGRGFFTLFGSERQETLATKIISPNSMGGAAACRMFSAEAVFFLSDDQEPLSERDNFCTLSAAVTFTALDRRTDSSSE
jgi:hypothetical protein